MSAPSSARELERRLTQINRGRKPDPAAPDALHAKLDLLLEILLEIRINLRGY